MRENNAFLISVHKVDDDNGEEEDNNTGPKNQEPNDEQTTAAVGNDQKQTSGSALVTLKWCKILMLLFGIVFF